MKKQLAVLLVLSIAVCSLFARGDKDTAGAQKSSKPQTLTMYLLGDRTEDFDKVFSLINGKLQNKVNAELEVKFLSWGEYTQKYPLLFASGEDFDIIYSADWAFYNAQSTKQGFYEFTQENLKKYAPLTAATIYDEAWEQAKVNGKVYMLPMNFSELKGNVYLIRGDLMKKYGMTEVDSLDKLEKYLTHVKEKESNLIPLGVGSEYDAMMVYDIMINKAIEGKYKMVAPWRLGGCVSLTDKSYKTFHISELPEYKNVVLRLEDWKNKGFWSKSALVNTMDNREYFKAGKSAAALMNLNTAVGEYSSVSKEHPEWDVRVFDATEKLPAELISFMGNGMSINSRSKNPTLSLQVIDLLRNDAEINALFCFGIEDEHYVDNKNGTITLLDANDKYGYDSNCNWGVRNDKTWKFIAGGIPNYSEIRSAWLKTAVTPAWGSFNFNEDSVKNEVAGINNVFQTYYRPMALGFSGGIESTIKDMQKNLKAAGADKVFALQSEQLREYIANIKK